MVENIHHPQIAAFFDKHPEETQALMHYIRKQVLALHPLMREAYKWHLPFYSVDKSFGYLQVRKGKVEFGLMRGYSLQGLDDVLHSQHLKLVRHLVFDPQEDVDPKMLKRVLACAIALY